MATKQRRGFTREFKIEAVKLVTEQGYKISEASHNLGISTSVLRRWRDQIQDDGDQAFPGKGHMTSEKEELHRLRKQVKQLQMERDILKKATGLLCQPVEVRLDFIRQQKKAYRVALLCRVMKVSRSAYYQFLKYGCIYVLDPDFYLISKVRRIHSDTRASYGSRRMSRQLRDEGQDIGRYRARSLMKKAGVEVKYLKRFKKTTDSNHKLPVAPNLLDRNFSVERPNAAWCADITCVWTKQGWLYLAAVIDLFSRKVVGWAISDPMKTSLVEQALSMAYFRRNPPKGLIHHSDRGSQYASHDYQQLIKSYSMICSMSKKGDCWDNAVAESFFHSLKTAVDR